MRRFRDRFRSHWPLPPDPAAENSHTPTPSDALAAVNEVLGIAENAVNGLPIPGLKQVVSIIRTVLQSMEVKVIDYLRLGQRFLMAIWFFLRNQTITKGR